MNAGQHGYYRVLYDDQNWEALMEQLKTNHAVFSAKVSAIPILTSHCFNNLSVSSFRTALASSLTPSPFAMPT
jgi:hypothetical protein